jgi:hypothetical protein
VVTSGEETVLWDTSSGSSCLSSQNPPATAEILGALADPPEVQPGAIFIS